MMNGSTAIWSTSKMSRGSQHAAGEELGSLLHPSLPGQGAQQDSNTSQLQSAPAGSGTWQAWSCCPGHSIDIELCGISSMERAALQKWVLWEGRSKVRDDYCNTALLACKYTYSSCSWCLHCKYMYLQASRAVLQ